MDISACEILVNMWWLKVDTVQIFLKGAFIVNVYSKTNVCIKCMEKCDEQQLEQ